MLTDVALPVVCQAQKGGLAPEQPGSVHRKGHPGVELFSTKLEQFSASVEDKEETALEEEPDTRHCTSLPGNLVYPGQSIPLVFDGQSDGPSGMAMAEDSDDSGFSTQVVVAEAELLLEATSAVLPREETGLAASRGETASPVTGNVGPGLGDVGSLPAGLEALVSRRSPALPESSSYGLIGGTQAGADMDSGTSNSTGATMLFTDPGQDLAIGVGRVLLPSGYDSKVSTAIETEPILSIGASPGLQAAWQGAVKVEALTGGLGTWNASVEELGGGDLTTASDQQTLYLGDEVLSLGPSREVDAQGRGELVGATVDVLKPELQISLDGAPNPAGISSSQDAGLAVMADVKGGPENQSRGLPSMEGAGESTAAFHDSRDTDIPGGLSSSRASSTKEELTVLEGYGRTTIQPSDMVVDEQAEFHQPLETEVGRGTSAKDRESGEGKPGLVVNRVVPSPVISSGMVSSTDRRGEEDSPKSVGHNIPNASQGTAEPDARFSGAGWTDVEEANTIEPEQAETMGDITADARHVTQPEASFGTRPHQLVPADEVARQRPIADAPVSTSQIVEQIVRGVELDTKGEYGEIRLQLKPEHLGDIQIRIAADNGVVSAAFVAESHTVKSLIEAGLPQLKQQMMQQGLNVQDVSVQVGGGSSQGSDSYRGNPNSSFFGGWFQGDGIDEVNRPAGPRRFLWGSTIDYRA